MKKKNTFILMNKTRLCVCFSPTPMITVHPVIMQMMRDERPVCHALLRKMRNSREWRLLRTQAGGKLTLAERRKTASEKRWVQMPNFTTCQTRSNNAFAWEPVASTLAGEHADTAVCSARVAYVGERQKNCTASTKTGVCTPILVKARRKGR